MTLYEITNEDRELIKIALETLKKNFDDGVYNHTVGAAIRCKNEIIKVSIKDLLPFAWKPVIV